jgi:hypothetical protein
LLFLDNSTLTDGDYHVSLFPLPYSKLKSCPGVWGE